MPEKDKRTKSQKHLDTGRNTRFDVMTGQFVPIITPQPTIKEGSMSSAKRPSPIEAPFLSSSDLGGKKMSELSQDEINLLAQNYQSRNVPSELGLNLTGAEDYPYKNLNSVGGGLTYSYRDGSGNIRQVEGLSQEELLQYQQRDKGLTPHPTAGIIKAQFEYGGSLPLIPNSENLPQYFLGGALKGAGKGAALGATLGSIVPGVGNVVGAGIGAVGGALIGGINERRQEKEQELAETQALLSQSVYGANPEIDDQLRRNQNIDTAMMVGNQALNLASGVAGNLPMGRYGGKMMQYENGGDMIKYQGPSHEEMNNHGTTGIPINKNGVPVPPQQAVAEVEGGETFEDSYIFSDTLKVPGKKYTFADAHKKLDKKYSDRDTDKIQKKSYDLEQESLKMNQETTKKNKAEYHLNKLNELGVSSNSTPTMKNGGKLPQYQLGGEPPYATPEELYPNLMRVSQDQLGMNNVQDINLIPESLPTYDHFLNDFNTQAEIEKMNPSELGTPQYDAVAEDEMSNPYQNEINPLGLAASNIGNIYDLYYASKQRDPNVYDPYNLERVNYDEAQQAAEMQAGRSRSALRQGARGSGVGAAGYLASIAAGEAGINQQAGQTVSDIAMRERLANNEIGNRESLLNTERLHRQALEDRQDKIRMDSVASGALHNVGQNLGMYSRDLELAQQNNITNQAYFDLLESGSRYGYGVIRTPEGKLTLGKV